MNTFCGYCSVTLLNHSAIETSMSLLGGAPLTWASLEKAKALRVLRRLERGLYVRFDIILDLIYLIGRI